jgi:hypothetical protein
MKKITFLSFKYSFSCLLFFLSGSSIANLNSLDLPKNIYVCEIKEKGLVAVYAKPKLKKNYF